MDGLIKPGFGFNLIGSCGVYVFCDYGLTNVWVYDDSCGIIYLFLTLNSFKPCGCIYQS